MNEERDLSSLRQQMVENQIIARGINDSRVIRAMRKVPRHLFVSSELEASAYSDHPLPIGGGQTISQPYIVALMTSTLDLSGNEKVLEVGTGSGYQAAILSELACEVHTVERRSELAEIARKKFEQFQYANIFVHVGDGTLGWPAEAPYDRIITTAAAPKVPQPLLNQLKERGKLIIPVGSRWRQVLELWVKEGQDFQKNEVLPVVFVPLLGEEGWQDL